MNIDLPPFQSRQISQFANQLFGAERLRLEPDNAVIGPCGYFRIRLRAGCTEDDPATLTGLTLAEVIARLNELGIRTHRQPANACSSLPYAGENLLLINASDFLSKPADARRIFNLNQAYADAPVTSLDGFRAKVARRSTVDGWVDRPCDSEPSELGR